MVAGISVGSPSVLSIPVIYDLGPLAPGVATGKRKRSIGHYLIGSKFID